MNDTTPARSRSLSQRLALAVVAIAPALASAACAAPAEDADADASARADAGPAEQLATSESELRPRLNLNPMTAPLLRFEEAPLVYAPAYWDAGTRTATTIGVGWYEPGGNAQTAIYRQRYDLDGVPVGPETLIKTFYGLPKGSTGFTDSPETSDDGAGPETDRLTCYRLVERAGAACGQNRQKDCISTQLACAYTQAATPHTVGRVQLRIKTSTAATAAAPGDHVEVRLQSKFFPYALMPIPRKNSTWLDSTQYDFTSGSDITYDLKLGGISDLSDITQITVATPNDDGLCINELELLVDNTRAFFKSFGADGVTCEWAHKSGEIGGSQVSIQFGELRRSPDWQGFNPPNLSPFSDRYASFVGYRAPELIAQLDAVFGDALRNPANGRGDDAGFQNTHWTTTRADSRRKLHVVQHVIAQDLGWQGNVAADPSYDLVIHHDASCGNKSWCIRVENVEANSSFSGWSSLIPLIGAGIQIAVNSEADGEMQKAMTAMGGSSLNDPPNGLEYCFITGRGVESPFTSLGFGAGSLTLCFPE